MKKFIPGRPSPAIVVAVIALVFALTGGAIAAGTISVSDLTKKAKQKTVGVGKLTYVTTNTSDVSDGFSDASDFTNASAQCPSGLKVIGGGVKAQVQDEDFVIDSYPTTTGWTARVAAGGPATQSHTFTTTAICAVSKSVTGAPPSS